MLCLMETKAEMKTVSALFWYLPRKTKKNDWETLDRRTWKKGVGAIRETKRSENEHSGKYKRLEVNHDFGKSQSGFWM